MPPGPVSCKRLRRLEKIPYRAYIFRNPRYAPGSTETTVNTNFLATYGYSLRRQLQIVRIALNMGSLVLTRVVISTAESELVETFLVK